MSNICSKCGEAQFGADHEWREDRKIRCLQRQLTQALELADKAEADNAALLVYVKGGVVYTTDPEILARIAQRDALLAQDHPGQPILDALARLRVLADSLPKTRDGARMYGWMVV
jgi:hypothetical protein